MSRIRSIKPEFPQSESIGRLSRDARLLFIQLWTIADDEGRARAASRMLASLLYPYDDDARKLLGHWLSELVREGCIRLYEVEDAHYLEIVNWLKHQRIDHPGKSRLPPFREPSRGFANNSGSLAPDLGPRILDLGPGPVLGGRKPTRPERDEKFEEFKQAYPKRKGANPWKPAQALFDRAVLAGSSADQIIAAAKSGVGYDREKVGTEYIPQAVKWLRDERWKDLLAQPPPNERPAYLTPPPGCQSLEEFRAEFYGDSNEVGAEIRSDGRMGKERPH